MKPWPKACINTCINNLLLLVASPLYQQLVPFLEHFVRLWLACVWLGSFEALRTGGINIFCPSQMYSVSVDLKKLHYSVGWRSKYSFLFVGHSALGPCFLAMAMYAFLTGQYFSLFDMTIGATYTIEVLVVLTNVCMANILVIAVAGIIRWVFLKRTLTVEF